MYFRKSLVLVFLLFSPLSVYGAKKKSKSTKGGFGSMQGYSQGKYSVVDGKIVDGKKATKFREFVEKFLDRDGANEVINQKTAFLLEREKDIYKTIRSEANKKSFIQMIEILKDPEKEYIYSKKDRDFVTSIIDSGVDNIHTFSNNYSKDYVAALSQFRQAITKGESTPESVLRILGRGLDIGFADELLKSDAYETLVPYCYHYRTPELSFLRSALVKYPEMDVKGLWVAYCGTLLEALKSWDFLKWRSTGNLVNVNTTSFWSGIAPETIPDLIKFVSLSQYVLMLDHKKKYEYFKIFLEKYKLIGGDACLNQLAPKGSPELFNGRIADIKHIIRGEASSDSSSLYISGMHSENAFFNFLVSKAHQVPVYAVALDPLETLGLASLTSEQRNNISKYNISDIVLIQRSTNGILSAKGFKNGGFAFYKTFFPKTVANLGELWDLCQKVAVEGDEVDQGSRIKKSLFVEKHDMKLISVIEKSSRKVITCFPESPSSR